MPRAPPSSTAGSTRARWRSSCCGRSGRLWPPSASSAGSELTRPGCIRSPRRGGRGGDSSSHHPQEFLMRSLRTFAVAGAVAVGLGLALAAPSQAAGTSEVSVLHGVPGLTVDAYANGNKLLSNFKPGSLTDPVALPQGTYDLKVFAAGKAPSGTPAIEAKGVKVPSGANITVVAHLDADGKPILTPYVNDTSTLKPGQARLTVRHDAAAPAVDVRAGGKPVFTNLTNPDEKKAD